LGFFWILFFLGAKEKPGFMVTGNSDFTSFFHEFCIWFRIFSAVAYSLCAAYFLHGKENGIYCHFLYDFFHCWLFSCELLSFSLSLSLSFAKEKLGFVVKTKG
jgi:hypothetical protein